MISTNHTPGPWTIDGERIGPGGAPPVALLCDINDHSLSGTVVDWPRMPGEAVDDAENEANALLIASAPALLRILQGFVSSRVRFWDDDKTPWGVTRFNLTANRALWDAATDICKLVTGEETDMADHIPGPWTRWERKVCLTDTYQHPEDLCNCWDDDKTPWTEAPPHIEEEHRIAANLSELENRCSVCDLEWSGQHNRCGLFREDGSRSYAYPRLLATTREGEYVEVCYQE